MAAKGPLSFYWSISDWVTRGPDVRAKDALRSACGRETDFTETGVLPWDEEPVVELSLRLEDLMGGVNREIVIFNDSSFSDMTLITEAKVVDQGTVDHHVTADGEDVSGCRFIRFDNGINLYFRPGLNVSVAAEAS